MVVLEAGDTGWEKIQSIFSAVRMWGGSIELAYAAQAALALALAASLVWLWRSRAADDLKAAALACACLLATPYVLDYDLVVLAVAIAFFVRHALNQNRGFRDYEISVLAFVWIAPLIARSVAGTIGLPLGFLAMAGALRADAPARGARWRRAPAVVRGARPRLSRWQLFVCHEALCGGLLAVVRQVAASRSSWRRTLRTNCGVFHSVATTAH